MARYRARTRRYFGVVTAITQLDSKDELRIWAGIECDLATGVALAVTLADRADSTVYATFNLQPGEKIVLSRNGDMPWDGPIFISGVSGGTAGYRGGAVYLEKT
jgi:hypothetical protein